MRTSPARPFQQYAVRILGKQAWLLMLPAVLGVVGCAGLERPLPPMATRLQGVTLSAQDRCGPSSQGWEAWLEAQGAKLRATVEPGARCMTWSGYVTLGQARQDLQRWCQREGARCEVAFTAGDAADRKLAKLVPARPAS